MRIHTARFKALLHLPQFLRVLLFVLLGFLLLGGVVLGINRCASASGSSASSGTLLSGASPAASYTPMKDMVVGFDGSYARAYSSKSGNLLWEVSPDGGQGYQCAVSDNLVVLYKAGAMSVYSGDGKIAFSSTAHQSIVRVCAGLSRIAVLYADDTIEIIDSTGKSVETLTPDCGTVMDYAFYSSSDLLWVLSLDTSLIEPKSTVSVHQPGKMLLASFSTSDQLYYQPVISGSAVYLVGDSTIDLRTTDSMTESSYLVKGWFLRDVYLGDKPLLLFSLTEQGENITSVRVFDGEKGTDLHLHTGCTAVLLGEKNVYGFSGDTVFAVPVSGGKTVSASMPCTVTKVLCRISGARALVTDGAGVYLANLPG